MTGLRGSEPFVKVGMRTYDGYGGFVDVGSSHGQVTPPLRNTQLVGVYHVNPDCTGTSIVYLPGNLPPAESDFAIVNQGKTVKEAVMLPQPNVTSAVFDKK